ncbi:MAG: hypothetical protein ACI85O_001285 [Saprospiraceae bacterium]|jgi:hypothetical protein
MTINLQFLKISICCLFLLAFTNLVSAQDIQLTPTDGTEVLNGTTVEFTGSSFVNAQFKVNNVSDTERILEIRREKISTVDAVTDGLCWTGPIAGDDVCYLAANMASSDSWITPDAFVFAANTEGKFIATINTNAVEGGGIFQYRYIIMDATTMEDLASLDIIVNTTTTANENPVVNQLDMSPNPASTFVEISNITDVNNGVVSIFSMKGEKVFSQKCNAETMTVSLENQLPGMYLVYLFSEENAPVVSKLIVK